MKSTTRSILDATMSEHVNLQALKPDFLAAYDLLHECFRNKGKLLVCGNGGSASDAEHIVGELMNKFAFTRPMPMDFARRLRDSSPERGSELAAVLQPCLPAISLVSQTSLITAVANDLAADVIFAQQVFGYGCPGDVLIAFSTSGNSPNVLNAAVTARALGMKVIGLTGETGGRLMEICDVAVRVPAVKSYRIQEYHQIIYHALCAMLEQEFFGE